MLARLKQGEPFGQVAKQMSDDRDSRDNEGSLDFREAKELPPDFVAALNTMQVGEVSAEPVKLPQGYDVIWLQDKRPPGRLSFDDVRDLLMGTAARQIEQRTRADVWAQAGEGFEPDQARIEQVTAAMAGEAKPEPQAKPQPQKAS